MSNQDPTAGKARIDVQGLDAALRPRQWHEFVGQERIKTNLRILVDAAKGRSDPVEHILLGGPAGLGKTTLAHLIAREMDTTVRVTSGPAMEPRVLDIMIGKGPSARTIQLELPPFTLIAATTRIGMLSSPLRSRFGNTFRFEFYTPEELVRILTRSASVLGVSMGADAAA